jgi:quercetin dioxygenase-like cupin family protein
MEKETLNAISSPNQDIRSFNPAVFVFDLPALVEKLKQKRSWAKGKLHAMILMKTPGKQIVLTTLHEGTEIKSFQSNDSITFQVIEGKLQFHSRKESVTLDKGELLTLHENIKYNLTTNEKTILLLTIASSGLQMSVN